MEKVLNVSLDEITKEIQTFQQQEQQCIFQIGKRLKQVKDADLVHGEWGKWLQSIQLDIRKAQRMIQAYEQFGDATLASCLGTAKIYEMLALPSEIDREQFIGEMHVVPSTGEMRYVDQMSGKELREVVRKEREKAGLIKPKKFVDIVPEDSTPVQPVQQTLRDMLIEAIPTLNDADINHALSNKYTLAEFIEMVCCRIPTDIEAA
ncbi:DUF3102 domain-containing protein [Aneurinibacillus aneurinilyticus]|uniref:DUF3102 domain-containing protein n=1 Tax=Aneurinibacillus aneurinilyticus TaxID=1391 RepID=UPI00366DAF85